MCVVLCALCVIRGVSYVVWCLFSFCVVLYVACWLSLSPCVFFFGMCFVLLFLLIIICVVGCLLNVFVVWCVCWLLSGDYRLLLSVGCCLLYICCSCVMMSGMC